MSTDPLVEVVAQTLREHHSRIEWPNGLSTLTCSCGLWAEPLVKGPVDESGYRRHVAKAVIDEIRDSEHSPCQQCNELEQAVYATRQMANDANGRLRALLLAALGIEDDGQTSLAEYVLRLTQERDEARRTAFDALISRLRTRSPEIAAALMAELEQEEAP